MKMIDWHTENTKKCMAKDIFKIMILLLLNNSYPSIASYSLIPDSLISYYPDHIGNKWFYSVTLTSTIDPGSSTIFASREIIKDTIINNRTYKKFENIWDVFKYRTKSVVYEYLDSTTGKLYQLDRYLNNESEIISDFSFKYRESSTNDFSSLELSNILIKNIFNRSRKVKTFYYQRYQIFRSFGYADSLGMVNYSWYVDFTSAYYAVLWCRINNIILNVSFVIMILILIHLP